MRKIGLEEYQYQDLVENKMYINIYDMSIKTLCEMNRYWKEFCYELLNELYMTDNFDVLYYRNGVDLSQKENLLIFLKNNYKMIIEKYKLHIDFNDYVELNDYVTLKDWLDNYDNHFIEADIDGVCLLIDD